MDTTSLLEQALRLAEDIYVDTANAADSASILSNALADLPMPYQGLAQIIADKLYADDKIEKLKGLLGIIIAGNNPAAA